MQIQLQQRHECETCVCGIGHCTVYTQAIWTETRALVSGHLHSTYSKISTLGHTYLEGHLQRCGPGLTEYLYILNAFQNPVNPQHIQRFFLAYNRDSMKQPSTGGPLITRLLIARISVTPVLPCYERTPVSFFTKMPANNRVRLILATGLFARFYGICNI